MNILLISSMYPSRHFPFHTAVCETFALEWRNLGHNVLVIHTKSVFPRALYVIFKIFKSFLVAYIGNDKVEEKRLRENERDELNGLVVWTIPVLKLLPHGKFSRNSLAAAKESIKDILKVERFHPDLIAGHFLNPQLPILADLKKDMAGVKCSIVLHENAKGLDLFGSNEWKTYEPFIDAWGVRSKSLLSIFKGATGLNCDPFLCLSGVPEAYMHDIISRDFQNGIRNFLFVGQLIDRKYPVETIMSVNSITNKNDYSFNVVGDGYLAGKIHDLGIDDKVHIHSHVSRIGLIRFYDEADCFIMISRDEVFGLVYLEAMARGCITIGSLGEGIDGVIIHGYNGFLVPAGDENELIRLLEFIDGLTKFELQKISRNAINTAKNLSDSEVAKKYLNSVI